MNPSPAKHGKTEPDAEDKKYTPLMISLSGKKIIIFGGGAVSERKALRFAEQAEVYVYSPSFTESLKKASVINDKLKLVTISLNQIRDSMNSSRSGSVSDSSDSQNFVESLIENAFLVIPATSDRVFNKFVTHLSHKKNILVNSVDKADEVIVPSSVSVGGLTISISSMGLSPAVTKLARMRIEKVITKDFEHMINLQDEIRAYLKEKTDDQQLRQKILWDVLENESVWSEFEKSPETARKKAFEIVENKIAGLKKNNHR